jgi:hypothetical protein
MSTEENKTIVRRRVNEEMISQNRLDLVDEIFAQSFVDHSASPRPSSQPGGCEDVLRRPTRRVPGHPRYG